MAFTSEKQHQTLLITGAGGFVGRRAVAMALARGDRVIAVLKPRSRSDTFAKMACSNLTLEHADLTKGEAVNELLARHPDIDGVLHLAAIKHPPYDMPLAQVEKTNIDAVKLLARGCEGLAAGRRRPLRFHFVSSISALKYEIGEYDDHPAINAAAYGDTKVRARNWLVDNQPGELKDLDVRITYPPAILGDEENGQFVSKVMKRGLKGEANFHGPESTPIHPELIYRSVHRDNYLNDVFACFNDTLKTGVQEYRVQHDYQVTMGDYIRLAKEIVENRKHGTPITHSNINQVPDHDPRLRVLPAVGDAIPHATHKNISLADVLAAQYNTMAARERATVKC